MVSWTSSNAFCTFSVLSLPVDSDDEQLLEPDENCWISPNIFILVDLWDALKLYIVRILFFWKYPQTAIWPMNNQNWEIFNELISEVVYPWLSQAMS